MAKSYFKVYCDALGMRYLFAINAMNAWDICGRPLPCVIYLRDSLMGKDTWRIVMSAGADISTLRLHTEEYCNAD